VLFNFRLFWSWVFNDVEREIEVGTVVNQEHGNILFVIDNGESKRSVVVVIFLLVLSRDKR